MAQDAKRELVDFLVREAFDPVLRAKPDGRSDVDKERLEHVQRSTRSEIERFRNYRSADDVLTNFRRDLSSGAAKPVHEDLDKFGLPTINDVRDRFEERARALGVHGGS